jgi:YbbR domain-containing protein
MITTFIKKMQDLWSKEWILKVISLCLAVLLWSFVGGEDDVEKNVMVPVEVINLPADLIISNKYKKDIEVTVRGPRSAIVQMQKERSARQIDLSKATPGTRVERMEEESIPVNRGVKVLRVQPSSIILSLDHLTRKELPINPVTIGSVATGYVLKQLTIDPKSITINGPETILSRVDVIQTTPINLQGLSQSMQLQIPLELDPKIVDLIGETSITADVDITYDTVKKTVKNAPVIVIEDNERQKVTPPTVAVTMLVPKVIITKNLDFGSLISVTAAVELDTDDTSRRRVSVNPSKELGVPLDIVSIEPEYVTMVEAVQSRGEQAGNTDATTAANDKLPKKDKGE